MIMRLCIIYLTENFTIAASSNANGGEEDITYEAGTADHVRLGDKGTIGETRGLRSTKLALGLVGQSYITRQRFAHRASTDRGWLDQFILSVPRTHEFRDER